MSSPAANSPRPRVLQVLTHLGLGGAERVALDLVNGLPGFDFGVFAVQGVAPEPVGRELEADLARRAIPLFCPPRWPWKLGGLPLAALHLRRTLRRFRPGIVHLHTEIPEATHALVTAFAPRRSGPAVVRTLHNSQVWHHWSALGRWTERTLVGAAVTAVSQDAAAAHARLAAAAGTAGRTPCRVIHNGVPVPVAARAPRSGPPSLLFAGRLEPEKGADLLPRILQAVTPPPGGAHCVVHGTGSAAAALRAFAARPPAGWSVAVRPPLPGLRQAIGQFDLVLVPSRFEGLPLVPLEALAAGVPIVATDAPGLREALPPDYPWRAPAGDAVAFAACVSAALQARERWPALAAAGRAFVARHFAPAAMLAQYRELYQVLADTPAFPDQFD